MSQKEGIPLSELKQQAQAFEEEQRKLNVDIEKIEKRGEIDIQKDILLRGLRARKRGVNNNLRLTLEAINEIEYEDEYKEKKRKVQIKFKEDIENILKDNNQNDEIKPDKTDITNKNIFSRNINMIGKYKKTVQKLRQEAINLMGQSTSTMSQQ